MTRSGEKIGWIGGWLGGFIWVAILAIIFLVQGELAKGILGLALTCAAVALILAAAPWKYPNTPYWKLMSPIYLVFFGSIAWAFWSFSDGGTEDIGLCWWNALYLLPTLIPLVTMGQRRWNDCNE